MPINVNKILVGFETYSEPVNIVTRKCYRCKQIKDIDCFKRRYCAGKHSYYYVKYTMTCSACLENQLNGIAIIILVRWRQSKAQDATVKSLPKSSGLIDWATLAQLHK